MRPKEHSRCYASTGAVLRMEQAVAAGEVVAATAWNDGYTKLKGEGIELSNEPQRGCHDLGLRFCLMKDHDPPNWTRSTITWMPI
ncbi:MAG: hypothetical protein CM1200mP30_11790 [Pseudomonadota bacterium]|nr:MAG: hypothetical protein CM1200mP30_11790 [Pseudomonadota bacterium]